MAAATYRARARQTREASRARIVAATAELVRRRSFAELSVDEVMREAGFGRTIFYRHFDDLADLLARAGREAIEELLEAQVALAGARAGDGPDVVREAIEPAVQAYRRHGPLLRAIAEAATVDERIAAGQQAMRERFDQVVEAALRDVAGPAGVGTADVAETAHALNLLNESYLLDAFGREPRVSPQTAVRTLTEIWAAVIHRD